MQIAMKGIAKLPALKPLDELIALEPVWTFEEQMKRDDDRIRSWTARVGEERAKKALDIWQNGKRGETGARSRTLPELLAEAYLRDRAKDYAVQVNLGWAHPDFALFDAMAGGVMVWRVQGTYWHGGTSAADAGQKARLLAHTIRGLPILSVVDIWEKRINESDGVFEAALRGEEMPG